MVLKLVREAVECWYMPDCLCASRLATSASSVIREGLDKAENWTSKRLACKAVTRRKEGAENAKTP